MFIFNICKIDGSACAFIAADKDIIDYLNIIYVLKCKSLPMIQTVGALKRLNY
jgi:hypothetical protein